MFRWARVGALGVLPALLVLASWQPAVASSGGFSTAMETAAKTRRVPLAWIEATAYVNTAWEPIFSPARNGGVGPMDIRPGQEAQAAALSGQTTSAIETDVAANLDAGAALIAHFHTTGTDPASWQAAVAAVEGPAVAAEIAVVMRSGASRTTAAGETITLAPQNLGSTTSTPSTSMLAPVTGAAATAASPDYAGATWIPAASSNYSVAGRPHDYPIDMIIIHDIEGSAGSAIQLFQTSGFAASAHYVVSYQGQVTQMVREKDIAWHAGNWDYNTRAIGIEHEGYAWTPGLYTTAEYNASAAIAASICSRYGVPMDRTHVIGHNQVPDPNNPSLFGGSDHHTDPGPYWNWTYYMAQAQADAAALPSPPRMMPDPDLTNGLSSVTVTWQPARTCRPAAAPITGYTLTLQPGGASVNVPASAASYTFSNLTPGTTYTASITAHNSYGDDTATSNPATPGRCASVGVAMSPAAPQKSGTTVQLTATSTGCPNPRYQFWVQSPGATTWHLLQGYSSSGTATWTTSGGPAGAYSFSVWAQDAASPGNDSNNLGSWDAFRWTQYSVLPAPCTSVNVAASPSGGTAVGTSVSLTATSTGCPAPSYEFWTLAPGATTWQLAGAYSTSPTFTWSTTGKTLGTYRFSVWARDASSPGVAGNVLGTWDAVAAQSYLLHPVQCASAGAGASPATSALVGTAVTLNATASGCPAPLYQFWLKVPGSSTWQVVKSYSTSATYNWQTTGWRPGVYGVAVWVRDASSAGASGSSLGRWDALTSFNYTLTSQPCTSVTATAAPAAASPAGTQVAITATASGCPGAQYEFWVLAPGSNSWTLAQAYSPTATFTWVTGNNTAKGVYRFSVWARDGSSTGTAGNVLGTWDAYTSLTYSLT